MQVTLNDAGLQSQLGRRLTQEDCTFKASLHPPQSKCFKKERERYGVWLNSRLLAYWYTFIVLKVWQSMTLSYIKSWVQSCVCMYVCVCGMYVVYMVCAYDVFVSLYVCMYVCICLSVYLCVYLCMEMYIQIQTRRTSGLKCLRKPSLLLCEFTGWVMKPTSWGWREGLVVKSTGSCPGPRFNSHHPHDGSQHL